MAVTNFLGLYLPIGTLVATATAPGSTTTFVTSDADASDVTVGMRFRLFTTADVNKETTTFTVASLASVAGVTTITFSPAASGATVATDRMYQPEKPDVTTAISNQMATLDNVLGNFECTSATRPVAPTRYTGMIIYETDTQQLNWWNGSSWQTIQDGKKPLGIVATVYPNTPLTGPAASATVGPYYTQTLTLVAGRTYAIRWQIRTYNAAAATGTAPILGVFRKASGGVVAVGSPTIPFSFVSIGTPETWVSVNTGASNTGLIMFTETVSGQYTIGMTFNRGADGRTGTQSFVNGAGWYIEDVGII